MSNATQELKLSELEKVSGGFDISPAVLIHVEVKTLSDLINSIKPK